MTDATRALIEAWNAAKRQLQDAHDGECVSTEDVARFMDAGDALAIALERSVTPSTAGAQEWVKQRNAAIANGEMIDGDF